MKIDPPIKYALYQVRICSAVFNLVLLQAFCSSRGLQGIVDIFFLYNKCEKKILCWNEFLLRFFIKRAEN